MNLGMYDDAGAGLDATWELELTARCWSAVIHSRSGSPVKNSDYFKALNMFIHRLAAVGSEISAIYIDSRDALRDWPDSSHRLLPLDYPIVLDRRSDAEQVRLSITNAQPAIARSPGASGTGGNSHRRIRIEFVPLGPWSSEQRAAMYLSGGPLA